MSKLQKFRDFVNKRLAAEALEIFRLYEKTLAECQEEMCRSKEKCAKLQRMLDMVIQPEIKLHRTAEAVFRGTQTSIMSGSVPVLLLLLVSSSWASSSWASSSFYGGTTTFYPKGTNPDGSYRVVLRYKLGFRTCSSSDYWICVSGDCGNQTSLVNETVDTVNGSWCQREVVMTRNISTNLPFEPVLLYCCWINNVITNGTSFDMYWFLTTLVDLGVRSDTDKANRSPQTTVLPLLQVAENCPRVFRLLSYDPDGDRVQCRFALKKKAECHACTLPDPSIFTLNRTSCTLTVSPTSSYVGLSFPVQLMMEDFSTQSIVLTYSNGSQSVRNDSSALSALPVQFTVRVGTSASSCTEGVNLPRFLPPTPAYGAQLYAAVNQTLEIIIKTQASNSTSVELLVSGPHNIIKSSTAPGEFTLRWTPSEDEDGEAHPICFIGQASSSKFQSELRCVIVIVGNPPPGHVVSLRATLSSVSELTEAFISSVVLQKLREELTSRGLPDDFTLTLKGVQKTSP